MAVKKVVTYGHPVLRKVSSDITDFSNIDEESDKPLVFINGRIDNTVGSDVDSEGCLSLPEIRINVERYESIRYKYLDRDLNKHSKNFSGLLARIIQHENDHLDGKLITDYATPSDLLKHGKALELMRTENTK